MTTPLPLFADRADGGRALARLLAGVGGPGTVVLGIPRGGVPVAFEVAAALEAPLDVLVSRRIVSPHDGEVVVGAIAETGAVWVDPRALRYAAVDESELAEPIAREALAIERQARAYRGPYSRFAVEGRTVLLVDDVIVTGASAHAAIAALKPLAPRRLVLAVPVADPEAAAALRPHVDALVAAYPPAELGPPARWFQRFGPVTDGEVIALLAKARARGEGALDAAVP